MNVLLSAMQYAQYHHKHRLQSPTSMLITPSTTQKLPWQSEIVLFNRLRYLSIETAMYHSNSSRRLRSSNSPEKIATQVLPPSPLTYSASDEEHLDKSSSARPVVVSINTMRESWNISSSENSSFLTSSNSSSSVLAANPPFFGESLRQQRNSCTRKKQDNIDWSELKKYSIEGREFACPGASLPEGDDFSSTAPLDDSEYSHVRSRSEFEIDFNFDEDQGKSSIPGADGCSLDELPAPPNKKNRRGTLTVEPTNVNVQTNDAPASPASRSPASDKEVYRTRRLEDDQLCQPIQDKSGIEDSQFLQRKIQRLLLIRHCTKCSIRSIPLPPNMKTADTEYFCPVTSRCAEGKALCAHIKTCKIDDCTYKKCLTTRQVLGHYMNCRDVECEICGPVRSSDKRRRNLTKEDIEWRHANMLL